MDWFRIVAGVGVSVFMLVAPQLGLPYLQAIPITGPDGDLGGADGNILARFDVEVGERVALKTLDAQGNRSALRVLWADLEGTKLDRATQGQGKVPKLVAAIAAPAGLLLGNDTLALRPGDEVTIDGFEGKWAYAPDGMVGILRVEGTVLAARLGEKGLRSLGTAEEGLTPSWALSGLPQVKNNVTVKAGRTAFVSTEAKAGDDVVKHVQARDVRINGARLTGTKWGEGPLDSVSFLAAGPGVLKGEDGERSLQAGQRVEVTDFIGAYVVFFTANDAARVALEGYARSVTFAAGTGDPVPVGGNRPPVPGFDWTPERPRAGQAVKFWDRSTDVDGLVTQREWRFGDGKASTDQHPSHAFDEAGTYVITLLVTDNRLVSSSLTRNLTIVNVPPQAKWEANPASPSTADTVQFADASTDPDGRILAWEWTFGDGATSREQHPSHRYAENGRYTVGLKVWDDDGETATSSRFLDVRNLAPQARFTWLPADPLSGDAVQFRDGSSDADGRVVAWTWDFGNGRTSTEQHPLHAFPLKGPQRVVLTIRDDDGATHAWDSIVDVRNRAPVADFLVRPEIAVEGQPVEFVDRSSDRDGRVVERVWSFGDGSISTHDGPTHTYLTGGNLTVALTVRDDDGARSTSVRSLHVNRRPVPQFNVAPVQPNTQEPTRFQDASVDPDGRVVAWAWDFGDGNASTERNPQHHFARTGMYTLALTVTDHEGASATLRRVLNVSNALPSVRFLVNPAVPSTGSDATFTDASTDPDGSVVGWSWNFGDGTSGTGRVAVHRYVHAGTYTVTLQAVDNDGQRATGTQTLRVNAAPRAAFTFSPTAPVSGVDVAFRDASLDNDGTLASWRWDFGDGGSSAERNPAHRFAAQGLYAVRLTVTDNDGGRSVLTRNLTVGSLLPAANFLVGPERPRAGETVQFTDTSTDADGRIVAWAWEFGDGGRSAAQNPAHTYSQTGSYRARLTVTDDAGKTAATERTVRVYSSGPLDVLVRVVYPDGQPVDLTRPGTALELRTVPGGVSLAKGEGLAVDAGGLARGTLGEGAWASGEEVAVTIRIPSAQVDHTRTVPLGGGDLGTIVLRMPMQGRIVLDTPQRGQGSVYENPAEQVRGQILVLWKDGTPVREAKVTLKYAWEQLGTYGYPVQGLTGSSGTTGTSGVFAFAVPFTLGLAEGPGSYLPGVYRIEARADIVAVDGLATWPGQLTFLEDPFGLRSALRD